MSAASASAPQDAGAAASVHPDAALIEPPGLRTLRRMVTVLTVTLTVGILTIAATLVIRIMMETEPAPVTAIAASEITLPAGEQIIAAGATVSALTVATRDASGRERLRVFHPDTGAPVGETLVIRTPAQ